MAAHHPSSRGRRLFQALAAATLMVAAGGLTAYWLYGQRVLLRAALGGTGSGGFTRVTPFALQDSLPALEGGLTNLEAFKVTFSPSGKANRDRSVWSSDSIGTITLEYLTQRDPLDSVTLLLWTGDGPLRTRTVRGGRTATWSPSVARPVATWTEMAAAYISYPPILALRSSDTSVALFAQAEGKVLHVVNAWYLNRREPALEPDTSYPLEAPHREGEPLRLMARGTALAVVNATNRPVRLRLTGVHGVNGSHAALLKADSLHVTVYRTLLKERSGHVMAYTDPGVTFAVFRASAPEPARFFVLAR